MSPLMMLCLTMLTAALGAENKLIDEPVAVDLHPVHSSFVADWQGRTRDLMGSRHASPLFRNSASVMDVHWRLAAYDAQMPRILPQQQQQAIDLAWLGASLGLSEAFSALIDQTPELAKIQQAFRAVTAPSVELQAREQGLQLSVNRGANDANRQRLEAAALNESGRMVRPPRLRLSSGLSLVQVDNPQQEVTFDPVRLGFSTMLLADRLGPLTIRSRASLLQRPEMEDNLVLDWQITGRLNIAPQLTVLSNLNGDEAGARLVSSGLEWRSPKRHRPGFVRLVASRQHVTGEDRVMLTYNRPLRWWVPNDVRRWPLGFQPGSDEPPPVYLRDTGPNRLTSLLPPPPPEAGVVVQDDER